MSESTKLPASHMHEVFNIKTTQYVLRDDSIGKPVNFIFPKPQYDRAIDVMQLYIDKKHLVRD